MRALVLILALAGCDLFGGPGAMPDLRQSLTRAEIDRAATPLLLAEVPARAAAATLAPRAENGTVVTWATADAVTLSFDGGVLVATRGLGEDLMAADVSGTLAALAGEPASGYARLHSYLDGENRTLFRAFLCEMAPPVTDPVVIFDRRVETVRHDETCWSTGLEIANSYWRGPDGTIWRARQWIGPAAGTLTTELLRR